MAWNVLHSTWNMDAFFFPMNDPGHCFLAYYHRLRTAFVRHLEACLPCCVVASHGYVVFCGLIALHGFAGWLMLSEFCMAKWRPVLPLLDQTDTLWLDHHI
jgi:hypothetical protein